TAGRPLSSQGDRGKSGLHGNTVPANRRRGRPQGKCHRKHTARASAARQPAGKGETGRQERTAPLATGAAGETPPGARPNRDGRAARCRSIPAPPSGLVARGASQDASQRNGRPAPSGADRTRLTGRLAFYPGTNPEFHARQTIEGRHKNPFGGGNCL